MNTKNVPPVVLVSGFLAGGGSGASKYFTKWYWGEWTENIEEEEELEKNLQGIIDLEGSGSSLNLQKRKVYHASGIGPVSSLHDRACELFTYIKGGIVDYGEEHSKQFNHSRYGRTFEGIHPQWSQENPIHLLGHSLGGCTIRMLQLYLENKMFEGHQNTSASWIRSITTISTPHKGTTTAYILGANPLASDSKSECSISEGSEETSPKETPRLVRSLSVGSILTRFVHVYEYLDIPLIKRYLDFNLDHWGVSRNHLTIKEFAKMIFFNSPIGDGMDNAAYDLTAHRMHELNEEIKDYPSTYYRSYATSMTEESKWNGYHLPSSKMSMGMQMISFWIGRSRFQKLKDIFPQHKDENWWENDGVTSLYSQVHPHECSEERCCHHKGIEKSDNAWQKGKWQVFEIKDCSHTCVVPLPRSETFRQTFFDSYLKYLSQVDLME